MRATTKACHPGLALMAAGLLSLAPSAARAEDMAGMPGMSDPHARCHQTMSHLEHATRTTADYALPEVGLVRDDGRAVTLAQALGGDRPVVLDFIFTTCTTICPVMSQTFTRLQAQLGDQADRVRLVSISIDPEQDTPARLAAYARRFHAGREWRLYTGTAQDSIAVQRAFAAYRGDKMDHTPVTFIRTSPGHRWVRIDGFASAEELARELHEQVAVH